MWSFAKDLERFLRSRFNWLFNSCIINEFLKLFSRYDKVFLSDSLVIFRRNLKSLFIGLLKLRRPLSCFCLQLAEGAAQAASG